MNKEDFCIYSHYDKNNKVQDYVIEAIKKIQKNGFNVIFVSTSNNYDNLTENKLKKYTYKIIKRENIGYDFGSYKTGYNFLIDGKIKFGKLLFSNDSVYGPFHDLNRELELLEKYDIVGITDSYDTSYHLQSYFLLFNESTANSEDVTEFFKKIEYITEDTIDFKKLIIQNYEIGGSKFFVDRGYKLQASNDSISIFKLLNELIISEMQSAKTNSNTNVSFFQFRENLTHFYWDKLLLNKCPYIKRELIAKNPLNIDISLWPEMISNLTDYPLHLIAQSLEDFNESDDFIYTTTKINANEIDSAGGIVLKPNEFLKNFSTKTYEDLTLYFDSEFYIKNNLDVKNAIELNLCDSALGHFQRSGHRELRQVRFYRKSGLK